MKEAHGFRTMTETPKQKEPMILRAAAAIVAGKMEPPLKSNQHAANFGRAWRRGKNRFRLPLRRSSVSRGWKGSPYAQKKPKTSSKKNSKTCFTLKRWALRKFIFVRLD